MMVLKNDHEHCFMARIWRLHTQITIQLIADENESLVSDELYLDCKRMQEIFLKRGN